MNDNPTIIESDLEGSVSSYSKRGIKSDSNPIPYASGNFKPEVILLSEDSEMEGSFGESLSGEAPSRDSSETLF